MDKLYDPKEPSSYIQYLDMNNLYGMAMCEDLPVSDLQWLEKKELDDMVKNFDLIENCTLEVDLKYPKLLRTLHQDYPLAPESLKVNGVNKLIPNLENKKKYVLNSKNLKLYLKHGLVLHTIHRGIKYKTFNFLKVYIESRKQAKKRF